MADISGASSVSRPMMSSTSFFALAGSAAGVGEGLRLYALGRVDDQHGALAGRERAADLVVEVDVPRRVDEVQDIVLAVVGGVVEPDGAGFYGDAVLALEVHVVEYLVFHLALVDCVAYLEQAVGQRGFPVVDMRGDGKVADLASVSHLSENLLREIHAQARSAAAGRARPSRGI